MPVEGTRLLKLVRRQEPSSAPLVSPTRCTKTSPFAHQISLHDFRCVHDYRLRLSRRQDTPEGYQDDQRGTEGGGGVIRSGHEVRVHNRVSHGIPY